MATGVGLQGRGIGGWCGALGWLAASLWVGVGLGGRPAAANPLVYPVDPTPSAITATLKATFDVSITVSCFGIGCGTYSGMGQVGDGTGAPLASNPTGSLTADWGSPGWADSITFSSLDLHNPDPGSAMGSFSIGLPLGLTATFDGTVNVNDISVALGSSVTVSPLSPSEPTPGAGPWSSSATANLVLGANAGGSVMGTGIWSFIQFTIPPFSFGGSGPGSPVPIDGVLSRLPNGSQLVFDAMGASIALGPQPATTITLNQSVGFGLTVDSVTIALTSLNLDNIDAHVVTTSATPVPVPEPGTVLLLGLGVVGMTLRRGRSR